MTVGLRRLNVPIGTSLSRVGTAFASLRSQLNVTIAGLVDYQATERIARKTNFSSLRTLPVKDTLPLSHASARYFP